MGDGTGIQWTEATWQPVRGWEGVYEVSCTGEVRRVLPGPNARVGVARRLGRHPTGYLQVQLTLRGRVETKKVHRLVAEAFLGAPPSPEYEVNHVDGDKENNHVSNLEWVTRTANMRHAVRAGLRPDQRGIRHPRARLDADDVRAIRAAVGTQREIASRFGISRRHAVAIRQRKAWRHV